MNIQAKLTNTQLDATEFEGMAVANRLPTGGLELHLGPHMTWKLLKQGVVMENRENGSVRLILRENGNSQALIQAEGYGLELPVTLRQMEKKETSLLVEYQIEGSEDIFGFLLEFELPAS